MEKEEEIPDIEKTLDKTQREWKASQEIQDQVLALLNEAELPTDIRATAAQFEEFYQTGINLYNAGSYNDALPYFHILMVGQANDARFSFAAAASYHMLKDYNQAAAFYHLTSMIDPTNPVPFYHLADCCIKLQDLVAAYVALDMGIQQGKNHPKHAVLVGRMQNLFKSLTHELAAKKKMGVTNFASPAARKEAERFRQEHHITEEDMASLASDDVQALDQMLEK